MDNRCDIYNVTLKSCKKITTGGLHYEQEVYQGVFQSDIRAIPQGIKRSQAYNIKRILCQCRIQQEICHPKTERTAPWKRFFQAKTPEEKHIWVTYGSQVISILTAVWEAAGYPCSGRLKATIVLWLPWIQKRFHLNQTLEKQLISISARQIDRRLKDRKAQVGRRIYGRTKPGTLLKHHIPIRTDNWDVKSPGWAEVDTVSHSGNNAEGKFAYTVNQTDILTTWVESRAVLGKGEDVVVDGLDEMAQAIPFTVKGLDSDNGSEFINWHLWRYCKTNKIQPFRGRPYKKDDKAHIEQKNWTHVRKLMGWDRYDTREAVDAMNNLYKNELRLFMNLFMPSMKLIQKRTCRFQAKKGL